MADAGLTTRASSTRPPGRVTALCDLFPDRVESATKLIKAENPTVYTDFEKVLAIEVDAVVIATPPFEHPRMLAAAVQSTCTARSLRAWTWRV